MGNLAEQLRSELTERARQSESCKKYLLDWVMERFRKGDNPVHIYVTSTIQTCGSCELGKRLGIKDGRSEYVDLKYENGKHYAKLGCYANAKFVDITDLDDSNWYACSGVDESDKRLFLESEGFHVYKRFIYGQGTVLEITY